MSTIVRWAACATIAALAVGCRSSIDVRTMAAPDAGLSRLHNFRMLPGPARRVGLPVTGADDPMISNSIANQVIRDQIVKSFQRRGYTFDEQNVDFVVAFYATAREKLDVTMWDYGYPFAVEWPANPRPMPVAAPYLEGSVIIDVLRAGTRQLLWRGQGKAELTDDPSANVKQLAKAAEAIVAKFPQEVRRVVAVRP